MCALGGVCVLRFPRGAVPLAPPQPGAGTAALQRGAALGRHRDPAVSVAAKEGPTAPQVHQDRSTVSPRGPGQGGSLGTTWVLPVLTAAFRVCCSCKQQQDLLSFLAVVLGLDNPAVSRLRLTWEVRPASSHETSTQNHQKLTLTFSIQKLTVR